MMPHRPRVLVVDDESDIRELISFTVESSFPVEIVEATSGNEAIEILKKNDPAIDCVVSDYYMPNGTGGDLFRYVKSLKKPLPFILVTAAANMEDEAFKLGKLDGYIEKPGIISPLKKLLGGILGAGAQKPAASEKYCRIRMNTLVRLGRLDCDLYVRLAEGKHVKVMKAGEEFGKADFARFEKKALEYLFIKASEVRILGEALEQSIRVVSEFKATGIESLLEVTSHAQEAIHEITNQLGFTPQVAALVQASVSFAVKNIQSQPGLRGIFSRLKVTDDHYISEHSTLLAYVAGGVAGLLGFNSESVHQKLACAAFLHDLRISNQTLARFQTFEEIRASGMKFDPALIRQFSEHPAAGARLAREAQGLPSEVDRIIEEHHERPDGSGFPQGYTGSMIHPLAAIFIVSHDLLNFAERSPTGFSMPEFVAAHAKIYREGPFVELLRKLPNLIDA